MFMFQNGLLATFIPEILMLLGYVMCLIAPCYRTNSTPIENTSNVALVSTIEHAQTSTYSVTITDFYDTAITVLAESIQFHAFVQKSLNYYPENPLGISAGLTFVQFSRPPPTLIS